jgi:hypothetical protein
MLNRKQSVADPGVAMPVAAVVALFLALFAGAVAAETVVEAPKPYTGAELEEVVAPVALYPDDLLAIVLPASAFPIQIVEAARFLDALESNPDLEPDPAWDDSVIALLNYPEILQRMNEDLQWTWRLGEAFVYQQGELMQAIQAFRGRAYAAGNLESDDHQVITDISGTIEIEPVEPAVVYVPYYEPERVVVYQPYPVYHYYPVARPVYYYPYERDYRFRNGFFWGVAATYRLAWRNHLLHVFDHWHVGHPFHNHAYSGHHYLRYDGAVRRKHVPRRGVGHDRHGHERRVWRAPDRHVTARKWRQARERMAQRYAEKPNEAGLQPPDKRRVGGRVLPPDRDSHRVSERPDFAGTPKSLPRSQQPGKSRSKPVQPKHVSALRGSKNLQGSAGLTPRPAGKAAKTRAGTPSRVRTNIPAGSVRARAGSQLSLPTLPATAGARHTKSASAASRKYSTNSAASRAGRPAIRTGRESSSAVPARAVPRTTAKPLTRQATRPVSRPAARPAVRATARPAPTPATRAVSRPQAQPRAKPAPATRRVDKSQIQRRQDRPRQR